MMLILQLDHKMNQCGWCHRRHAEHTLYTTRLWGSIIAERNVSTGNACVDEDGLATAEVLLTGSKPWSLVMVASMMQLCFIIPLLSSELWYLSPFSFSLSLSLSFPLPLLAVFILFAHSYTFAIFKQNMSAPAIKSPLDDAAVRRIISFFLPLKDALSSCRLWHTVDFSIHTAFIDLGMEAISEYGHHIHAISNLKE